MAAENAFKTDLKKGDQVVVIAGRDKGKRGRILRVLSKENAVVVERVNVVKRHTKPTKNQSGGIIEKEHPLAISNVMIVDPATGNPTRIRHKLLEDGRKVRVAARSGETLDA